jgi:hypothetical protein
MPFTGYSINGIALHDRTRGWAILRAGTNTQGGITKTLSKATVPGRPGYKPGPSTFTEQALVFVVSCTREGLDSLLALCDAATTLTRTDDPTKVAFVELASAIPSGDAPMDAKFEVSITLIAYQGAWRDVSFPAPNSDGTQSVAVTSPTQTIVNLVGLSAPVSDMQVFIGGQFGEMTLVDSGGSFLKTTRAWPGTSSHGLLFNGSTSQAYLSNLSSPWVPVSDASQYIDTSGNGGFRLTPKMVSGNPADRRVELTLTTLAQTSTTFRIKAKRAYRMN